MNLTVNKAGLAHSVSTSLAQAWSRSRMLTSAVEDLLRRSDSIQVKSSPMLKKNWLAVGSRTAVAIPASLIAMSQTHHQAGHNAAPCQPNERLQPAAAR